MVGAEGFEGRSRVACPRCGAAASLAVIGERVDRRNRWLPWMTTVTHICACMACGEIVDVAADRSYADDASGSDADRGHDLTRAGIVSLPPVAATCTTTAA